MGQFGDSLVYGNSGGHGLLEDYGNMNRKMDILMARDESRKSQVEQVAKRVSSLEITVRRLTRSSEGYLSIRRRFFDVYKRDIMAVEELKGSKAIQEGNMLAHEGDALGDAVLFDNDQRTDKRVYRELYGLDHEQVLSFGTSTNGLMNTSWLKLIICIDCASDNGGLFLVLNAHATMVAQGKIIPQDLKVAFDCFLAKVEENWLKPPDKDPNTPLGCAYYNFWKIFNQQPKV